MKNLINIIQEKLKVGSNTKVSNSSIDLLVELLIKHVLYNQNIKNSDFEFWDDTVYNNMYTLYNVPQDFKYFKQFYNEVVKYDQDFKFEGKPMDDMFPDAYFRVNLKDDKKTFIKFDIILDSKEKGINSIDMTENVKKLILNKIK